MKSGEDFYCNVCQYIRIYLPTMKTIATLLAALTLVGAGSLKADDIYQHSAFGHNPIQSPPTIPVRIVN